MKIDKISQSHNFNIKKQLNPQGLHWYKNDTKKPLKLIEDQAIVQLDKLKQIKTDNKFTKLYKGHYVFTYEEQEENHEDQDLLIDDSMDEKRNPKPGEEYKNADPRYMGYEENQQVIYKYENPNKRSIKMIDPVQKQLNIRKQFSDLFEGWKFEPPKSSREKSQRRTIKTTDRSRLRACCFYKNDDLAKAYQQQEEKRQLVSEIYRLHNDEFYPKSKPYQKSKPCGIFAIDKIPNETHENQGGISPKTIHYRPFTAKTGTFQTTREYFNLTARNKSNTPKSSLYESQEQNLKKQKSNALI